MDAGGSRGPPPTRVLTRRSPSRTRRGWSRQWSTGRPGRRRRRERRAAGREPRGQRSAFRDRVIRLPLMEPPSPEEAAAVIAAIEQFLVDTTPPPSGDGKPTEVSPWVRAARLE